jgi:hypothetical protein
MISLREWFGHTCYIIAFFLYILDIVYIHNCFLGTF